MLATQRALSVSSFASDLPGLNGERTRSEPYFEGNLTLLDKIECPNDVMCCRFTHDGSHLAVGFTDGTIRIYCPHKFINLYTLSDEETRLFHLPCTQIRFHVYAVGDKEEYSHILLATYASGLIKFWHYTTGKCLHTTNEGRQTLTTTLNPDGKLFLTAGADPRINLYDEHTKQLVNSMEPSDSRDLMDGHVFRVFCVQYHPHHPNIFLSGGWDNTVQYWDDRKKRSIRKIYGPHICGDALDIDVVHDHVLTGSWRKDSNVLQIWDFASGRKIKDVPQDNMNCSELYCTQWLGKDSIICGGTNHNMARIIDRGTLNTTGQLVDLPQSVYCIDNDRQSNVPRVAIGTSNNIYIVKGEKPQDRN